VSAYSFSQDECRFEFLVTDSNEVKELTAGGIERAFNSIDTSCLKRNAEYSEMVNKLVYLCLTHKAMETIEVLSRNKCEPFYNTVLNEIDSPVSDMFDFQTIFCNISTLKGSKTKKVKNAVLERFTEGMLNNIPEANRILQSDCH
jgi:hypothetical protein